MGYDPVELDPEEMCRMATEEPQVQKRDSAFTAQKTKTSVDLRGYLLFIFSFFLPDLGNLL